MSQFILCEFWTWSSLGIHYSAATAWLELFSLGPSCAVCHSWSNAGHQRSGVKEAFGVYSFFVLNWWLLKSSFHNQETFLPTFNGYSNDVCQHIKNLSSFQILCFRIWSATMRSRTCTAWPWPLARWPTDLFLSQKCLELWCWWVASRWSFVIIEHRPNQSIKSPAVFLSSHEVTSHYCTLLLYPILGW